MNGLKLGGNKKEPVREGFQPSGWDFGLSDKLIVDFHDDQLISWPASFATFFDQLIACERDALAQKNFTKRGWE